MEPWATLIKEKQKHIETRSWKTEYKGELYIHASLKSINRNDILTQILLEIISDKSMKYGSIICKSNLVDCIYMDEAFISNIEKNKKEYMCGFYEIGRYAWILEDTEVLAEPILAKGKLRIWDYNSN